MTAVYAAYSIGDRHVTILYKDACKLSEFKPKLEEHLQSLPTRRKAKVTEFVELDNHKSKSDPIIAAKLVILTEDGDEDIELMKRIAEFSDTHSFRENLVQEGKEQYKFTMHTSLGPKSEVGSPKEIIKEWNLVTGRKYYKNFETKEKIWFD